MRAIIGKTNAGFNIIEAEFTSETEGYFIGKSKKELVTWWFRINKEVDFYHGDYFPIDPDAPRRAWAKTYASYHRRLMQTYESISKYGE